MGTSSVGEENLANAPRENASIDGSRIISSTAETIKRAINNNPGMALLISASIGVALACLIKRR